MPHVLCPPAVVAGAWTLGLPPPKLASNQQRIDGLIRTANPCYHIGQAGGHAHIRHQLNRKRFAFGGWLAGREDRWIPEVSCYSNLERFRRTAVELLIVLSSELRRGSTESS